MMASTMAFFATMFPRKVVYELLFLLAEFAVKQTDNTVDDKVVEKIKSNFKGA